MLASEVTARVPPRMTVAPVKLFAPTMDCVPPPFLTRVIAPAVWLIEPVKVPFAPPLPRLRMAGEALVLTTEPEPTRVPIEIRAALAAPVQFETEDPAALRSRVAS